MKDTIQEDDMLIDLTKTEIEKRLERSDKEKEIMQEKMKVMEEQIKELSEVTKKIEKFYPNL
jgi:adenylate kinase family enzyme